MRMREKSYVRAQEREAGRKRERDGSSERRVAIDGTGWRVC